jgi:hypothetical protein
MKQFLNSWKRFLIEGSSKGVVTFDFDDTLLGFRLDPDWGIVQDQPKHEIIQLLKKFKKDGYTVYIVTSRYEKNETKDDYNKDHPAFITSVADFVELHTLPIDGIFFTNGMLKFKKLIELESIRHHDDNPSEIEAIKQYAPHIEVVVV